MPSVRTMLCLASVAAMSFASAQITVEPMAPVTVCGSATLQVAFNTTDVFDPGNVFTVELSDISGSFSAPTVIGIAAGTAAMSIQCTFPVGIALGNAWAIRVVASDPAVIGDAYVLPITTVVPPNAGTSANMSVCSNAPSFSMLGELGGSPESGGAWISPNGNPLPNFFVPGTSPAGCYTYTVAGPAPCANVTAVLCITVSNAPSAGTNVSFSACGGPPIDMQAGLPLGGAWAFGGAPHSNIFVPGVDAPGPYQYTMPGIPPCTGVTHTAWMMVDMLPNAGANATVSRCMSQGDADLFALLAGSPDPGGTWTDTNTTGQLVGGTFVVGGMPSGNYVFTYTVAGGNCPDAQATVTVNLNAMCIMTPQAPYPVE